MSSRKTFETNSLSKLLCGMYGFFAKLAIPTLNILGLLIRLAKKTSLLLMAVQTASFGVFTI